jgi:hypothetical protein
MNLNKIVFLYVEYGAEDENNLVTSAKSIRENVESLLSALTEGKYKYFIGKKKGQEYDLTQAYPLDRLASLKEKYSLLRARKVRWLDMDIDYHKLKQEIAEIHRKEPNAIFDVTAVSKEYIGDIFAIGVIEGIEQICTFKFKAGGPNFDEPWKSLYHELPFRSAQGYDYLNLTTRPIYVKCGESILIRRPPLIISLFSAIALLIVLIGISFIFGPTNWFVLTISGLATIASILSLYYTIFPLRK